MWSFFPWPVLLVIPAMIVMGVLMARRMDFGHRAEGLLRTEHKDAVPPWSK